MPKLPAISFFLLLALTTPNAVAAGDDSPNPKKREFLFTYGTTITKLKPGQKARIWLPIPPTTQVQKTQVLLKKLPGKVQRTRDKTFGNSFYYIEAKANADGRIPLAVSYRIRRSEVIGDKDNVPEQDIKRFLQANRFVPVKGKPLSLLPKDKQLPANQMKLGQELFRIVNKHMKYSKKGKGWGRGDAVWACDSGYGNCTDFHSLFISLSRSQGVPAKFEIGFALPEKRGNGAIKGYHCWAYFQPKGHGWIPVDISQANQAKEKDPKLAQYLFGNLTENRVTFSVGRDLVLEPKQSGSPLNYFIYPHVEVDGEPYDRERVISQFFFQDLEKGAVRKPKN